VFTYLKSRLKNDIAALLDTFLIGSIGKSPSMVSYNLTTKVNGKTRSRIVRKNLVPKGLEMSAHYKKLWSLIQTLSGVNWEILNRENISIKPARQKALTSPVQANKKSSLRKSNGA
jgi:hypothetical protein